jgi:hypothetical protein
MFHPDSEKNKFGYYSVGIFQTYSKFEALEISQKLQQPIQWHFNDEIFSSYNWTIEPEESIEELYRQQAQSIRDRYDYLVLMFSGGIDSTNILHAFVDNNIKLDEICSIHEYSGTKDSDAYCTGEILNAAIPYIKKLEMQGIKLKYRIVDNAQNQFDAVDKITIDLREESYYDFNNVHNLGNLARFTNIRTQVADYQKIIDSGKRLCLIWGEAKPLVEFDAAAGKHKFVFKELSYDMICGPKLQNANHPGYHDEMFYHSPHSAKLIIKQSHLCLKKLKNKDHLIDIKSVPNEITITNPTIYNITNPALSKIRTQINDQTYCLNNAEFHRTIYPLVEPPIYNQWKNTSRLFHPRDNWLIKGLTNQSKKWFTGYFQLCTKLGPRDMNKSAGYIPKYQIDYYIE